ncbi:MAG: preprotein translocase subunit SecA, partial [Opitutales bacterium]|nr:preprotein translocase subunit SecA [Opitutales bacterium]
IYKLTVMPIPTNKPCRRVDHPDLIFKTKREKFQAACEKIRGANLRGQPVLVGTASVEDSELLSRLLKLNGISHEVLNAKNDAKEAEIVARAGEKNAVTISTNMAGRGTDIKLAPGVEELGGLLVIGMQRYESSRVDRQLQGRCARQGDRGESVFLLSLEDELLRLHADTSFLSNTIRKKYRDGCPFSHPIMDRIVRRAQKKADGENYTIRKRMLQFDDASNKQREIVYSMRSEILEEQSHNARISEIFFDCASALARRFLPEADNAISEADLENLAEEIYMRFGVFFEAKEDFANLGSVQIVEKIAESLKNLHAQKREIDGEENSEKIERAVLLNSLDENWQNHITYLEDLKDAIYLRSYAQKDPLGEYKIEAYKSFEEMMLLAKFDFAEKIFSLAPDAEAAKAFAEKRLRDYAKRRAKIA